MEESPNVKHRLPALALLMAISLLVVGLATVTAAQSEQPTLVRIPLRGGTDLDRVEASGLPVYARFAGEGGTYLLAGASPIEAETLQALGLEVDLLDADTRGASYYLVATRGERLPAAVADQVQILHTDGIQALVRGDQAGVAELAQAGFPIAGLELDPIALRPRFEASVPEAVEPEPRVAEMIAQVDQATLRQYEAWLTGDESAQIGGQPYTIATRHTHSGMSIQKATQFVYEHLANLGLEAAYHQWEGSTYPNVIATKEGLNEPDDIFLISAHLDDLPEGEVAPGADDNASGSTGVLVAADILSQYEFGCTLKFALWTGEEQGMRGSRAWAVWAREQGLTIRGVLNVDMIAYESDDSPVVDLHARTSLPGSVAMANLFVDVVEGYDLNLTPDVLVDNWLGDFSDNKSFWDQGYVAILAVEDHDDFNPNYHKVADRLSALNIPYMTEVVKASVATLVHTSDCLIDAETGYLDGYVTVARGQRPATVMPIAGATVSMRNDAGRTLQAFSDGAGYYTRTLPTGTYTVTASAAGYQPATFAGVSVLSGAVTTQDFELESIPEPIWRLYLPLVQRHE